MLLSDQTQLTRPSSRTSRLFDQHRMELELCKYFKIYDCFITRPFLIWLRYDLPQKGLFKILFCALSLFS